jgi:1-acyl-sn-glycerol-3-phosphate acyltransferase
MKILKEIAGRIWALWGLITFIFTFSLIFLPSMLAYIIPEPTGTRYFIWLSKVWIRIWLFLVACPLRIKGQDNFEKGKVYVVTPNHNSIIDPTLSCPFIPGPNKTIAKDFYAKIPIFGWYYARGAVLINREDDKSRNESYWKMKRVLEKGIHMSIYPEGTRNRSKEPLKRFYDGAFRLAVESKNDIIPAILMNTKKALPFEKTFFFWPTRFEIHFLSPVVSAGKTTHDLKDEVYKIMDNYLRQYMLPE